MIIERVTGTGYANQLSARLLVPLALRDTYYRSHLYPPGIADRMPAGYYTRTDEPELSPLRGTDVSRTSMSWARGAGAILSTTADMTRWERALYDGWLLPPQQQAELLSLVSTATGEPIEATGPDDPRGFGLGVAQMTDALGTFWRSEEHTSELQSRQYLVCRLLLEKKPLTAQDHHRLQHGDARRALARGRADNAGVDQINKRHNPSHVNRPVADLLLHHDTPHAGEA